MQQQNVSLIVFCVAAEDNKLDLFTNADEEFPEISNCKNVILFSFILFFANSPPKNNFLIFLIANDGGEKRAG